MATIKSELARARGLLKSNLECEILLAFVIKKSREFLTAHPEYELKTRQAGVFLRLMENRHAGVPVAYLTNHKEFYGLDFYVDARCLIPRPETEMLVEETLSIVNDHFPEKHVKILDVGTGSGAIAIALGKNIPLAEVTATDISSEALEIAEMNITLHGLQGKVRLIKSDLLFSLMREDFDIIVANLPYIGTNKFNFVEKEVVDNEPNIALFGGDDGLGLYESLFEQISKMPQKPRFLLGEFGFLQRESLEAILNKIFIQKADGGEKSSVPQIIFKKDLASLDRLFIVGF